MFEFIFLFQRYLYIALSFIAILFLFFSLPTYFLYCSFFLVSPRTLFLRETAQVEVEHTVDMLVLLLPPAGGDDLQGVTAVSAVVVLQ